MKYINISITSLHYVIFQKLKRVLYEIKNRGIGIGLKRISNEILSSKRMLVYRHQHNQKIQYENYKKIIFLMLNEQSNNYWLKLLVNAWPNELEHYRNDEYLESAILRRLNNGEICIIAHTYDHELLGSVWIADINPILLNDIPSFSINDKMLKSLFVINCMRGKGIGKILLVEAVNFAQQKGASNIWSLIKPDRKKSIALHETVGFILEGEIIKRKFFFKEISEYWPTNLLMSSE